MTITVTHSTVADASFSATGAVAWDATHSFAGVLDVANGGTGTATPALVAGTNVTITGAWPNQTIAASGGGGGSGTVTSVSVVSANGFAGTVATDTTTPAITVSTSITGVLKGNGAAISAASAGTDYQAPITLTTTGTSGAATFVSNTLNIPQYSGGGGSGTVTSVAATVPSFLSVTGSPITASGTLAISYSGTALPIANGGTGQTTASAAFNNLSPVTTTGDLILGNGANSATRLPIGTNGQILTSDGSTAAWGSRINAATAVNTTSGTSIDFTSIPSWVKRITVVASGVSSSGTSTYMIRIGTAASFLTTGYADAIVSVAGTSSSTLSTTGFSLINGALAANAYSGQIILTLLDTTSNFWAATSTFNSGGNTLQVGGGGASLADTLTRVRLTTSNGTDTFDAGKVNILYE
jgi:hypothetical protein